MFFCWLDPDYYNIIVFSWWFIPIVVDEWVAFYYFYYDYGWGELLFTSPSSLGCPFFRHESRLTSMHHHVALCSFVVQPLFILIKWHATRLSPSIYSFLSVLQATNDKNMILCTTWKAFQTSSGGVLPLFWHHQSFVDWLYMRPKPGSSW